MYKTRTYTYHDEWIKENYASFRNHREIWTEYCKLFGDDIPYDAFRHHLTRKLGIKSRVTFTDDEKLWMCEHGNDYENLDELTNAYNERFLKNRSCASVYKLRNMVGLAKKHKPIGTIYDSGYGYMIKVSKGASGHIRYSRYVFEKKYGKTPSGYCVIHLDNDIYNNDISNLVAVPKSWLGTMQQYGWFSKDRNFTITAVKWCELRAVLKGKETMIPNLLETEIERK